MAARVLSAHKVSKVFKTPFGGVTALKDFNIEISKGEMLALVGPDGAGKTTFLRLAASLLKTTEGTVERFVPPESIAYMPQKFGLYEDLTVQENLNLYASLNGLPFEERPQRFRELLRMSAMEKFTERLAGALSGGMKQKLGLICTLVKSPQLLLLDEPTVGVDPFSRIELWDIVRRLTQAEGMSVIVSTSYLDEAERCDQVLMLSEGKTICGGTPAELKKISEGFAYICTPPSEVKPRVLQSQLIRCSGIIDAVPQGGAIRLVHKMLSTGQRKNIDQILSGSKVRPVPSSLEDTLMLMTQREKNAGYNSHTGNLSTELGAEKDGRSVISAKNVYKHFGSFTAVDNCSFEVYPGEIFGLLGPNGAGKTTTFRMLCGLLPATQGELFVAGVNVRQTREAARAKVGYVAQKFSLYGPLTVKENLNFFAECYGLFGAHKKQRIEAVLEDFSLTEVVNMPAEQLPGGYKRRLSMACALLHEPEILFLDEPTSGADPIARREFWLRITDLSERGVTVVVTTHFMEEAEYCDRIVIQDAGKTIASGTPEEVRAQGKTGDQTAPTMEEAFVAIVSRSRGRKETP